MLHKVSLYFLYFFTLILVLMVTSSGIDLLVVFQESGGMICNFLQLGG